MSGAMKSFDPIAIKEKMRKTFLQKEHIRGTIDDTVIDSILAAVSEHLAEAVRYDEYLTRENVWEYMRNLTSAVGTSRVVGYEPKRKRAAITTLTFSIDPNILKFGGYSDVVYEETINEDGTTSVEEKPGIVGYENLRSLRHFPAGSFGDSNQILIPAGRRVTSAEGIEYITLEDVSISAQSDLELDKNPSSRFTSRWAMVSAIQGVRKTLEVAGVRGREFERVTIVSSNVENMKGAIADNYKSIAGLSVEVQEAGVGDWITWKYIDDVRRANPYEKVFAVETSLDYSFVDIIFGNNYSGRQIPKGSNVRIKYLETEGQEGNIFEAHQLVEVLNKPQDWVSNPSIIENITVTNLSPVINGAAEDTLADIKAAAPQHYLTVSTIGSTEAYQAVIESLPNVRKARVFRTEYKYNSPGFSRDAIGFTALAEGGLSFAEQEIVQRVREAIGNRASPTDILQYEAPEQVAIRYNIQGFIEDVTRPLQYYVSELSDAILSRYGIDELQFKSPIYHVEMMALLKNTLPVLRQATAFPEAIIRTDSYLTQFALGSGGVLQQDFKFNTSLAPFREMRHNVGMVLRLDFVFQPSHLKHRSRSIIVLENPNLEEIDKPFIIRQFGLLGDIVMTPERTRTVLSDASNIYNEKTQSTWHWCNVKELINIDSEVDFKTELPDVLEFKWAGTVGDVNEIDTNPTLEAYVDTTINNPSILKIVGDVDTERVFLVYTKAIDLDSTSESEIVNYVFAHRNWRERTWANDIDFQKSEDLIGIIGEEPLTFPVDENQLAPIEVSFLPHIPTGLQAGTGSIFIKPTEGGKAIKFLPDDVQDPTLRSLTEEGISRKCYIDIIARPLYLDLTLENEYSIFRLDKNRIKFDLKYRTEFDAEFPSGYEEESENE